MKKIITLIISVILVFTFVSCGNSSKSGDDKTIKVGASPVPHKEILEAARPLLEKEGYKLEIIEFTDYVIPNSSLNDKSIDANFFQHIPYLNNTVKEKSYDLDYTVKVHLEPLGIYSKKIKDLKELKSGAKITIPNDPTNGGRSLKLLEKAGLIKLKNLENPTVKDIVENKNNYLIEELEAPQLPRTLDEVDISVINTNYALEAQLNPTKDSLFIEGNDSPFANILAVRKEDKESPKIKALSKALTSSEVKKFIEEKYKGSIVPAF